MSFAREVWTAYKLRMKRRRLLYRALRKRRQLTPVTNRTKSIARGGILAFVTVRDEAVRLPHFLDHYRALGVGHFLFVDNGSTDGTAELLGGQPDVSLWQTGASYRASRFGVDWLTWLLIRYGHGHWCLTLDADEILIYPHHTTRPLRALTDWLDAKGQQSFPAMMLDMYPSGALDAEPYEAGGNPFDILKWFDGGNYTIQRQSPMNNLWIQGGPRARVFFHDDPRRSPTLNKTPLVKWNRRFVYINSTHSLLPRRLNETYDADDGEGPSGLLLHTKFLHTVVERSAVEKDRKEHFSNSALYDGYYDELTKNPSFRCTHSTPLVGWRQLESMGLMSRGTWL